VAHDIRSPLAALAVAEVDFTTLPEETRLICRSAVERIRDISNQLLEKNRTFGNVMGSGMPHSAQSEEESTQLLSSLIEGIVSERRMQYRQRIGVEIELRFESVPNGVFSNVQPTEFKRMLSNLVNNGVEALSEKGRVSISLETRHSDLEIRVSDNGKGISGEILAKLGQRGETYGKVGGSGLGLYHARTSVETWGGTFEIQSQLGFGTSVIVTLPRAKAPRWFAANLELKPGSTVVVLDDDDSIHRVWNRRAESAQLSAYGIELAHFYTPDELRAWKTERARSSLDTQYLLDHELLGFKETGLDLIEELDINERSILVTSHCEESLVRERYRKRWRDSSRFRFNRMLI
jgi:anti-sigma regulatory factor (Ser/Thr protein kinase)